MMHVDILIVGGGAAGIAFCRKRVSLRPSQLLSTSIAFTAQTSP